MITQEHLNAINRLRTLQVHRGRAALVPATVLRLVIEALDIFDWKEMKDAPKGPPTKAIYLLGYCPDEGVNPESRICIIWWEEVEKKWFSDIDCTNGVRPTKWTYLVPSQEGD